MQFKHFARVLERTVTEILTDLRSRDFAKVFHLFSSVSKHFLFGYPYTVSIEPINQCNLNCEFCTSPPWMLKRKKNQMLLEDFKKIVDELSSTTHYLWLFLSGEPFLNKDLPKMIAFASKKGMHVVTSTNAMLLDAETARAIVNSGLDRLIISFDGATKQSYEQMRKGASFEKLVENTELLIKEKKMQKKFKPIVELQFLVSRINENETTAFKELTKAIGADKFTFKSIAIPEWLYDRETISELQKKFLPLNGKSRYDNNFRLKNAGECSFLRKSIILSDGSVCICCFDLNAKYCLGNALEKPFIEIWNSEQYKSARELMRTRSLELCNQCAETEEY